MDERTTQDDLPLLANAPRQDFTTGSIPRHILKFAVPMFAGNLLQSLYSMVDSVWVGRFVGPEALGAVALSMPIVFVLVAMVMGIGIATTTMVAQYAGARDHDMVKRTVINSLLLLSGAAVVVSVVGIAFRVPILRLINTPPELMDMAADYLAVIMSGMIVMFLYNAGGAALRGFGDSKTPVLFLVYSTVINIVIDPFLILGLGPFPRMGVVGAGVATVIAQTVAAVLVVRYLVRIGLVTWEPRRWRVDRALTLTTMRIGFPSGLQQTLVSLGMMTMYSIVNTFGPVVVAAFGAGMRIDQFSFLPAMTISIAVAAVVGQNLGAGREDRVREAVKVSLLISSAAAAVFSLVVLLFPRQLLTVFTDDPGVIAAGMEYLRIIAFSFVPFALMFTFTGVLRGAGDAMPTMLITIVTLWGFRVPAAVYLSSRPELGVTGVWLAFAASPVLGTVLNWLYYLTGRWKDRAVVRRAPQLAGGGR